MLRQGLGTNITAIVNRLASELQNTPFYNDFLADVQTTMATQNFNKERFGAECYEWAQGTSLDTRLRNALYHLMHVQPTLLANPDTPRHVLKEPLTYIRKAQSAWERRLVKCVNSMAAELGVPLARRRTKQEREDFSDRWADLSTEETDLTMIRPVYAPKDFLEVLASLRNPNYDEAVEENLWGSIQLPLKVNDIKGLVELYGELAYCCKHTGLDEAVAGEYKTNLTLAEERLIMGQKVVERNHGPLSRELIKSGCPTSLRGVLWHQVLGLEITEKHYKHFDELVQAVHQHDLLVDKLIMKDIQLTASNDDQYFVFEDILFQVLLCFFRDTEVLSHFEHSSASPPLAVARGNTPSPNALVAYPPCGVIPFHGFTMYAAPLSCLYEDPVPLYFTFREMYCRYWYRLHVVTSHSQGAAALALQFELLLQSCETRLWQHCCAMGIQLLPIVFKWIVRAFSGYLVPDQLFHLWDVVLAWESLEVLPVLALAIVSFRRENLMDVTSQQAAEAVLADITAISVIPLLKLALAADRGRERES
ncbi:TBC1 domain family member 19-like [Eriocheir sinensis]|uniref:TBC1 domain family member 19-like n=1 Tax=Eriocheir sinensis TaxID=95602 RepID=UPI0021C9A96B|nr:TBC1 domain family member 19-like [Eriocheir sinensis]